jgi:pyruvate decarboxylase
MHGVLTKSQGVQRNQCLEEAHELQSLVPFPTFVTAMGKGSVNEENANYGGVYGGAGTHSEVKKAIESTDCALWLGRYGSDFNTGEFTMNVAEDKIIDLQRFFLTIGGKKIELKMKYLLRALIENIKQKPLTSTFNVTWDPYPLRSLPATGNLTQDFLWNALSKFFQPGDVIVGETGTSMALPSTSCNLHND